MLNALEELRKIRTATATNTATACTADLLPPKGLSLEELPSKYPTNPTKGNEESTDENGGEWNQSAADVLDIVARASQPIPHPQIVKAMAGREYTKKAAYVAIAFCQKRGWIEHNLETGYLLS